MRSKMDFGRPVLGVALVTLASCLAMAGEPTAPSGGGEEIDARCVDALYQIQLLQLGGRVYKPGPGGTRTYLDDRDRPAELTRLARVRDEACSVDPGTRGSQERRAAELYRTLSPDCVAAREKLQNLLRPDSRSVPEDVERQRAFVDQYCPDPGRADVWLGDWGLVRQRA